jgi:anthranilate/para-aminobenzoate synthase component II
MRNFTPHGTQVFLVRPAAVDDKLIGRLCNVKVVLIIPGPKAPKNYAPYWQLVLKLFADASPLTGVFCLSYLKCAVPTSSGSIVGGYVRAVPDPLAAAGDCHT